MRPLVLFEFIFGLILFCERTLSRHQISNACQFLLASIYNEMCLISVTDIKMDYNDVDDEFMTVKVSSNCHQNPSPISM